jgi:hypothetical protein
MNRTSAFAIGVGLLVALAAWADVPLPKDIKYIDPRVKFERVKDHADQVFHLRFLTFSGGPSGIPYRVMEVKDSEPFNLNAQRRLYDMKLLAMDRKEFEKRAKDDPSLKWLTDKTEGVLSVAVSPPSTTASVKVKEAPVTTYRVNLKEGKLSAERVGEGKRTDAGPTGLLPVWAFGIIASLSVAWFGIWYSRRGWASSDRGA